jgi:hypothetical protein
VLVEVHVRPRSRAGWEVVGERLVVRVGAAPVGGAATDEARRVLAGALGVAPGRVSLRHGARSRVKVFAVAGLTVDRARAVLRSDA